MKDVQKVAIFAQIIQCSQALASHRQSSFSCDCCIMSGITAEFKTEFKKLIELKQVAPNEHLQKLMAVLKERNLMYEVECINPKNLLTHKES